MKRMNHLGTAFLLVLCTVIGLVQTNAGAYPTPLPVASAARVIGDVGIAAPTGLMLFTDPNTCLNLGPTKFPCYKAVEGGGLFLLWAWTQPCGHVECRTADQFVVVRRSGGSTTTQDRYAQLYDPAHNLRGVGLLRGQWAVNDCFTVRALNLATNMQSADSNQVCARLFPRPVVSPGAIKE
jgi:hypothetical protein